MAGYGVFIVALRKAGLPRALSGHFALMILHPASLLYNNHALSDTFYAAILPLALGGSLLTLFTRKFSHAVWTGAYAVLWNTRRKHHPGNPRGVFCARFAPAQRRAHPKGAFCFLAQTHRGVGRNPGRVGGGGLFRKLERVPQLREIGPKLAAV
jgi:hypothetical protein